MNLRGRDFRFNQLTQSLWEVLDNILVKVHRGDDPAPECPVCRTQGLPGGGKMVRHTRRGAVCDQCGTRVW